ncbi:MAG: hypothetical protein EOO46_17780 [Flavobacterium sp.]|nr:MAG: hypothetical protein EOO46_17780 [Flavobacterium sp.]
MAAFVKDTELNLLLEDIIKEANEQIVLFCPYFKLHDRLRDCLKLRVHDPEVKIIVVFGKNEDDPSKSLHREDLEFLKSFPNVEIAYEKRLHAKYYANEKKGVITSLNLHTHSHNNNIEVGVMFHTKNILKQLTDRTLGTLTSIISDTEDLATEAQTFFIDIYRNAEKIYQKEPKFKHGLLNLTKSYTHSDTLVDRTDAFYTQIHSKETSQRPTAQKTPMGFQVNNSYKQEPQYEKGFCIRTREKISFNPGKPLSYSSYQTWSQFGNPDFREKYCHGCGKSHVTSVRQPLCRECSF